MRLPVAIVGNGAAAAEAVLELRRCGYSDEIHLFYDNDHPPYNPMLCPYLVSNKIPLERAFPFGGHASFYEANAVITHPGTEVVKLDAEKQILYTAVGTCFSYDRCLLATGARSLVPPVDGLREALSDEGTACRTFTLRTLSDALRLRNAAAAVLAEAYSRGTMPRAAVVGASFAGVKVATVLHDMGFRVAVIEREQTILPLSAYPECARLLERHLLDEGYELLLGATLLAVGAVSGDVRLDLGLAGGCTDPGGAEAPAEGARRSGRRDHRSEIRTDLVVVCAGSRPSLGILEQGQVDAGEGVLIDEQCRSNIPTLYAAGDVAQGMNLATGRREVIGLWASARAQGRAAGRGLAGATGGYRGGVPSNITHVGRMLFAGIGCPHDYDRVESRRRDGACVWRTWRLNKVTGVNLVNGCLEAGKAKHALLRMALGGAMDKGMVWTGFDA